MTDTIPRSTMFDVGSIVGLVGSLGGAVVSFTGIAVGIKAWPALKSHISIIRERDAAIDSARSAKDRETAALASVNIVKSASEGWQSAANAVGAELKLLREDVKSLRLELDSLRVESAVGIQYICDLISRPEGAPLPPYPTEIRDEIIRALRLRSQTNAASHHPESS